MTSRKLKNAHPKVYREFFSNVSRAVSAPHSFFWTGDLSVFSGGTAVVQKIPRRLYVGLAAIGNKPFECADALLAYSSTRREFVQLPLHAHLSRAITEAVGKKLKGFRLSLMSEVMPGTSLGFQGALAACLACLLNEGNGKRFDLAIEISKNLQEGRISGTTAFAALTDGASPIAFHQRDGEWWGKSLELETLPFDYGLVFSGALVHGDAIIKSAAAVREEFETRQNKVVKILGAANTLGKPWEVFTKNLELVSQQLIVGLDEVCRDPSDRRQKFVFNTLNQYQNLLHWLEVSSTEIDGLYGSIHKIAAGGVGAGAKVSGVGKGGCLLFAIPFGRYREAAEKLGILEYASWRDGLEGDGVLVEQDIERAVVSPILSIGQWIIESWQNGSRSIFLSSHLRGVIEKFDLVLDELHQKVYISGNPVNSKQLFSQKATVAIFAKLLRSPDWQLKNREIPVPAYANSRYDLQSKILIPLQKTVNAKNHQLTLELTGGMYDDYALKIKSLQCSIALVKPVRK